VTSYLLVHDDRAQLTVIANKDNLLGAQHQWQQRLWLSCLCALINQQLHQNAHITLAFISNPMLPLKVQVPGLPREPHLRMYACLQTLALSLHPMGSLYTRY